MKMNVLRVHEVKCNPEYFEDLKRGRQRCQLRTDDRDYRVGDFLRITPNEPRSPTTTFAVPPLVQEITHVMDRSDPIGAKALKPGWVLLSVIEASSNSEQSIENNSVVQIVAPKRAARRR